LAVLPPGRFVGVRHVGALQHDAQLLIQRPAEGGCLAIKVHRSSRDQRHAKEILQDVLHLAVRNLQVITQVSGDGARHRADVAATQFPFACLVHRTTALRTDTLPVNELRDPGSRHQHDVFLNMLVQLRTRFQVGALAVRTDLGSGNVDELVNVVRRAPTPAGMAHWRPTSSRLHFDRDRCGLDVRLELLLMLEAQLGDLRVSLQQRLLQFINPLLRFNLENVELVAQFGLIVVDLQRPGGGQAVQVGALVAKRTLEAFWCILAAAHGSHSV
jgi:hypothetical protein